MKLSKAKMSYPTPYHTLISVCAWCPKSTHPKLKEGEEYTHGICNTHLQGLRRELKAKRAALHAY